MHHPLDTYATGLMELEVPWHGMASPDLADQLNPNSSRGADYAGVSSLRVPGVPWHTQILADQLTLFQPGGTDYAHLSTTGTPGFSDLPTAL